MVVVLVGIGTMLVGTLKQFGDGMEPPRPLSLTIIRCIWDVVLHEPMINWNKVSNTHIKKEKEKKKLRRERVLWELAPTWQQIAYD